MNFYFEIRYSVLLMPLLNFHFNIDFMFRLKLLNHLLNSLFYVLGRRSITRLALPCDRSIVPGSTTRTVVVTPTKTLI